MNTEHLYPLHFQLNGEQKTVTFSSDQTLLNLLRQNLHAWEVKEGCGKGDCGACTVLVDGEARLACLVLAVQVGQTAITTVRGLGDEVHLHPLQQAFIEYGAAQCGFCTPGMLMTAKALLATNPHPTRIEIRTALAGNLCRCTGYQAIIDAIEAASRQDCSHAIVADERVVYSLAQFEEKKATK
jgi:aerobic carbon-monoxide dehydrogenase small subunit